MSNFQAGKSQWARGGEGLETTHKKNLSLYLKILKAKGVPQVFKVPEWILDNYIITNFRKFRQNNLFSLNPYFRTICNSDA